MLAVLAERRLRSGRNLCEWGVIQEGTVEGTPLPGHAPSRVVATLLVGGVVGPVVVGMSLAHVLVGRHVWRVPELEAVTGADEDALGGGQAGRGAVGGRVAGTEKRRDVLKAAWEANLETVWVNATSRSSLIKFMYTVYDRRSTSLYCGSS